MNNRLRNCRATSHKPRYDMSRYIPVAEYAKLFNYSTRAVLYQIYGQKIEAIKRGGRWYVFKPKKLEKK